MTALKGLALAAALVVGTSSLAMAQAQSESGPHGQLARLIIPHRLELFGGDHHAQGVAADAQHLLLGQRRAFALLRQPQVVGERVNEPRVQRRRRLFAFHDALPAVPRGRP